MINSNVATITLNGAETTVEFENGYPYYFITNKSDTDIYVSISPNITPKAEGVYTVSAGTAERIGSGYALNKFYIKGSGEAYIRAETIAALPSFKRTAKGGDSSGSRKQLTLFEGSENDYTLAGGLTGFEVINGVPAGAVFEISNADEFG